jgi:hypothetical protein
LSDGAPIRALFWFAAGWIVVRLCWAILNGGDVNGDERWAAADSWGEHRATDPQFGETSGDLRQNAGKLSAAQNVLQAGPFRVDTYRAGPLGAMVRPRQAKGPIGSAAKYRAVAPPTPAAIAPLPSGVARAAMAGGKAAADQPLAPAILPVSPVEPRRQMSHVSAFLFLRPGSRAVASPAIIAANPLLGGSQAGFSYRRRFNGDAPVEWGAIARIQSAIDPQSDARLSLGLYAQPLHRVPIFLGAEARVGLDQSAADDLLLHGNGGTSLRVGNRGGRIDIYGQAGAAIGAQTTLFAHAQTQFSQPLITIAGEDVRLGAALNAGGQGTSWRVDAGPQVQWRLPFANPPLDLRLAWRERLAGNADPATGLAITLSSDF